jgi:hypothetical protein
MAELEAVALEAEVQVVQARLALQTLAVVAGALTGKLQTAP